MLFIVKMLPLSKTIRYVAVLERGRCKIVNSVSYVSEGLSGVKIYSETIMILKIDWLR